MFMLMLMLMFSMPRHLSCGTCHAWSDAIEQTTRLGVVFQRKPARIHAASTPALHLVVRRDFDARAVVDEQDSHRASGLPTAHGEEDGAAVLANAADHKARKHAILWGGFLCGGDLSFGGVVWEPRRRRV